MDRRDFVSGLIGAGALAAAPLTARGALAQDSWTADAIEHLLQTVNDRRLLLKASFARPLASASLVIGDRRIAGQGTDSEGKFWQFDAQDLNPNQSYRATLIDAVGRPLGDSWPIRTLPDPQDMPENLR